MEMLKYVLLGVGLLTASVRDLKRHTVWVPGMVLMGAAGFGIGAISFGWQDAVLGCLPGILLYGISRITRGAIGEGDALVFGVCGIYLGLAENLLLLWLSLFLAMLAGSLLLFRKKGNRKTRLPLVPFILAAYIILWSGRIGI